MVICRRLSFYKGSTLRCSLLLFFYHEKYIQLQGKSYTHRLEEECALHCLKICQHWRRLNGQQIIHKICLKKINYFYSFGQKLCIGEEKIQMFHILHLNCFLHLHTELFVERTLMKSKNGHDQVSLFSKETGLYVYKQMWNIKVVYKKNRWTITKYMNINIMYNTK